MQNNECIVENSIGTVINGVKTIQKGILPRSITRVIIPSSVQTIYEQAVLCDAVYDGIPVTKEEIDRYDSQNIIRIATFKKFQVDYSKMPDEVFNLLPLTNDAIKGYKANYVCYQTLYQAINPKEKSTFFKICYTMGLFVVPPKTRLEVEKVIAVICNYPDLDSLTLQDVDLTFIQLVLGIYRNGNLSEFMPYYTHMYSKCREVCKTIRKIKEQKIYKKRKELDGGFFPNEIDYFRGLVQEIEELELHKKTISFSDIKDYFQNHVFIVREGNEVLERIIPVIRPHIASQDDFDILQDIYEEAKRKKPELSKIFTPLENKNGEFTYKWLENDAGENLILGYLTDSCAKLDGAGKDIMRLSMTHPQVRTLVVYDSSDRIIGKMTVYYSLEGKYLLGNNIEVAYSFMNSSKTTEKQREMLLQTFQKGLQTQIIAMNERGYTVEDVRIGMLRNDLEEQLSKFQIEYHELLPNIKYGTYAGDASNSKYGQAIIPIERGVKK